MNVVKGHTLLSEGAPYLPFGGRMRRRLGGGVRGEGHGVCSCGALSPMLTSGGQRKRWHRQHKAKVVQDER